MRCFGKERFDFGKLTSASKSIVPTLTTNNGGNTTGTSEEKKNNIGIAYVGVSGWLDVDLGVQKPASAWWYC
ncbi:hypothetical protein TrispH2_011959, partial [Trichoplax sp. H2]